MNSTISTNEDLIQLSEELQRIYAMHTMRILVAVQDFSSKRLLQGFFQQKKFRQYQTFDKGTELIQTLMNCKDRCLVIYDLEMPDKNGLELLAVVRKNGEPMKNVQVLMCTGSLQWQAREKLMSSGVNAMLQKPFSQESLLESLKELHIALPAQ
ncbi:MAG TPA: response regulator [Fibrobacteraceae bacterium]|nr:response regulator [Fibrobacteraceae bacterium]